MTSDQRPPTRVPTWVWSGVLVVLMVLTSLAVASVSVWLLLPYFALMALILFTPTGRGEREMGCARESEAGSVGGEELADERAAAWVEDESVGREWGDPSAGTELVVEPAEAAASDSESRAVKTKRGKGRMRKAKAVAESLGATATWIQIGPGKFVRVENPGPTVAAAFPSRKAKFQANTRASRLVPSRRPPGRLRGRRTPRFPDRDGALRLPSGVRGVELRKGSEVEVARDAGGQELAGGRRGQWLRERFPPRTWGWTRTWSTIQARLRMRRGITVSHRMPSRRRRGITVSHRMLSSTSQRPGSKPRMLRLRIVVRVRSHQTTSPDVRTDRRSARSGPSGDGAGLTLVARRRGDPARAQRPQDALSGRAEGPGFHPAFAAPHAGRPDGPDNPAGPFHHAHRRSCGSISSP